jgi:hypothetical protein
VAVANAYARVRTPPPLLAFSSDRINASVHARSTGRRPSPWLIRPPPRAPTLITASPLVAAVIGTPRRGAEHIACPRAFAQTRRLPRDFARSCAGSGIARRARVQRLGASTKCRSEWGRLLQWTRWTGSGCQVAEQRSAERSIKIWSTHFLIVRNHDYPVFQEGKLPWTFQLAEDALGTVPAEHPSEYHDLIWSTSWLLLGWCRLKS